MGDGSFEEMKITEVKTHSVLQFTWADDVVRFELYPNSEGCQLTLIE
ncbi:hypothetical protein [Bacillus sp. FJAT-49711]